MNENIFSSFLLGIYKLSIISALCNLTWLGNIFIKSFSKTFFANVMTVLMVGLVSWKVRPKHWVLASQKFFIEMNEMSEIKLDPDLNKSGNGKPVKF